MIIYEKEYCMVCSKENPQDGNTCECGGRDFIFGNNFTYKNRKVICVCGNREFEMTAHFNMNPFYSKTYKCTKCENHIGVQTYYKSPYFD